MIAKEQYFTAGRNFRFRKAVNYNKETRKRRMVEHSSSENGAARIVSVNRKAKLAKIRF